MQLGARESRHVQEDHVERNRSGSNDTHTYQRFLEVRGYCRAETLPNVRGLSRFQEGLGLLQMTTNEKSSRTPERGYASPNCRASLAQGFELQELPTTHR